MSTIHQQLYATLVGRVDHAVTVLDNMIDRQDFDWFHVIQVTEMLKAALLEAEEAYMKADEETERRLIVLPHVKHTGIPDRAHPQE